MQALDAAKQAVSRFEQADIPWARPADYYAEMVKSDQHMSQVKQQLVHQQDQIEGADERYGPSPEVPEVLLSLPHVRQQQYQMMLDGPEFPTGV